MENGRKLRRLQHARFKTAALIKYLINISIHMLQIIVFCISLNSIAFWKRDKNSLHQKTKIDVADFVRHSLCFYLVLNKFV